MQNVALKIEEPVLLSVLYLGYLVAVSPTYLTPGNRGRGADPDGKGRAGYGGVERVVRPPKMAVVLLSVRPQLDQCLLHLHPTHMTDLPARLPQAPASDCSHQRGGEGHPPLLVSAGFPGN